MVKMLAGTTETPLFKIEYQLDIFVKHQSKLEFGMGNSVFFPIDVKSNEVDLPFVAGKEAEWMRLQNLSDWEPTRSNPPVSLHLEVNPADNSYIPRSTWNGGQLTMRKTNSNLIIDQGNMDRLRENTEAAEAQYRA